MMVSKVGRCQWFDFNTKHSSVRRKTTANVLSSSSRETEENGYANPSYLGDSKSNSYAEIDTGNLG